MQVWTGKLSELQLPVQNPAREGTCTSMSYWDRCVESGRISVPFITLPKFPSFSSNISKVIESLMNLENHGEMFVEPSARMDIPSSADGRTDQWTKWNQYTTFNFLGRGYNYERNQCFMMLSLQHSTTLPLYDLGHHRFRHLGPGSI